MQSRRNFIFFALLVIFIQSITSNTNIVCNGTSCVEICNYICIRQVPWPGDSEGIFRSLSQAATCPLVYHTRQWFHSVPLIAEHQAGKL